MAAPMSCKFVALKSSVSSVFRFCTLNISYTEVFQPYLCTSINLKSWLPVSVQTRSMSRVKRRKTHPYHKLPQKFRVKYPEYVSPENETFIKDVVHDTYGPETIVGGPSVPYVSPLREPPWERGEWKDGLIRTGLIGRKIGIYPMWKKDGTRLLTTVIQIVDNHVIRYKTPEQVINTPEGRHKFGYKPPLGVLVIGAEAADPQLFTKEYCNLFTESGVMPKRKLTRFYISPQAAIQPGTPLFASHFTPGQYVDVQGLTIDWGFQGVMKRWKMKGGPATHGTTKAHRRIGSIASGQKMARVWPGRRMPGHMGCEWRVLRGVKVWRINTKYNVLWVQGPAIPGGVNDYVYVRDSMIKDKKPNDPPFPTRYVEDTEDLAEEIYDEELHVFSDPTITLT